MLRGTLFAACLLAGLWQLGGAAWLLAKAELAQYLIAAAWEEKLSSGESVEPWPWADTRPVAKLQLADREPLMVLAGGSGQALAVGP
ncbi:class GN sortase, partial [Microbulbifer halophilus]